MELTLFDFLLWLASSAGASMVASFVLERLAWYQGKQSEQKKWIFFASASLVSVGAFCVITYVPMNVLEAVAPFFALVASVFVSVFSGQVFHQFDRSGKKLEG